MLILETLIFSCLLPGTKFSDTGTGKTISLKPIGQEVALFFKLDDDSDTRKACLGITGKCCDCLVYFADVKKSVFCLAELKGKNADQAAKQIINTYDHLSQTLTHSKNALSSHIAKCPECASHANACPHCKNTYSGIAWKAIIHQKGASPNKLNQTLVQELVTRFGKHGEGYDISHKEDIGYLLRK